MNASEKDKKMTAAGWVALTVLGIFLGIAIWYAAHAWMALSGVPMSPMGWFFLGCGIVVTFVVGAVLMGLVFYSSRKNFDR